MNANGVDRVLQTFIFRIAQCVCALSFRPAYIQRNEYSKVF